MRVRSWLLVILLVFVAAPSQAQRPASPAASAIKRFLKLVPRLLGDHLSPPKPTSPADTTTRKCSGTSCK